MTLLGLCYALFILLEKKFMIVRMIDGGGVLSYCNHSFDDVPIIDLEFGGVLEDFYEVNIDG